MFKRMLIEEVKFFKSLRLSKPKSRKVLREITPNIIRYSELELKKGTASHLEKIVITLGAFI